MANVQIDAMEGTAEVGRKEIADVQINATEGAAKVSINTKGTVDISTNTEGPSSLNLNAKVKASILAPTYLAPNPAVATWARSRLPTPYTDGSRKSPQLIQPPSGKSLVSVNVQHLNANRSYK